MHLLTNGASALLFSSAILPEGGAGKLLFFHIQKILQRLHLSLQHCILVLALDNEILKALSHVQLTLRHLIYSQTKLG